MGTMSSAIFWAIEVKKSLNSFAISKGSEILQLLIRSCEKVLYLQPRRNNKCVYFWWRAHNSTRLWLRRHSFSEKFLVTTVSRLVHPLLFICSSTYKAQSLNTVMWLLVQEYWHVADSAELHSKKKYPMKTDLTSSQLL